VIDARERVRYSRRQTALSVARMGVARMGEKRGRRREKQNRRSEDDTH
jgi:hypothetical protein